MAARRKGRGLKRVCLLVRGRRRLTPRARDVAPGSHRQKELFNFPIGSHDVSRVGEFGRRVGVGDGDDLHSRS